MLARIFHISAHTAYQGGLVLLYFPGSLRRRNILDAEKIQSKGFHMSLKACAHRKNGMVHLLLGLATR